VQGVGILVLRAEWRPRHHASTKFISGELHGGRGEGSPNLGDSRGREQKEKGGDSQLALCACLLFIVCIVNIDNHSNICQEGDVFYPSGVCFCPSGVQVNSEGSVNKRGPMANKG
jgi:hypothetical protein